MNDLLRVRRWLMVVFSGVCLVGAGAVSAQAEPTSKLEVFDLDARERRVVLSVPELVQAPNWSRDGATLLVNGNGRMYTVPVGGGTLTPLDTGEVVSNNNDHGYSPDGKWLAISSRTDGRSPIYVLPATGGTPRQVTFGPEPSFWYGWSPDGKAFAFVSYPE